MTDGQDLYSAGAVETASDIIAPPMYFPVSLLKLVIMSTCTFGIYELYWFYRNWCFVRTREAPEIMPFWRAFFSRPSSATRSSRKFGQPQTRG